MGSKRSKTQIYMLLWHCVDCSSLCWYKLQLILAVVVCCCWNSLVWVKVWHVRSRVLLIICFNTALQLLLCLKLANIGSVSAHTNKHMHVRAHTHTHTATHQLSSLYRNLMCTNYAYIFSSQTWCTCLYKINATVRTHTCTHTHTHMHAHTHIAV